MPHKFFSSLCGILFCILEYMAFAKDK